MRRDVILGLLLAPPFASAALLPASTLLTRPHSAALTSSVRLPEITARAALELRQTRINSICGYWSASGSTYTLSCDPNVACLFSSTDQTAAVGYCSNGTAPVTAIFDYGACPSGGAQSGQLCCASASPFFGAYFFNHGSSAILTCGATRFRINATTTLSGPVNASATTTASSSQPTQAQGNNTTNSAGLGKWATVGLVVGIISGIVTFVAGTFAILKCLNRKAKPGATGSPTPHIFNFHGPLSFNNCAFELRSAGEQGATARLLSNQPRALLRNSSVHTLHEP